MVSLIFFVLLSGPPVKIDLKTEISSSEVSFYPRKMEESKGGRYFYSYFEPDSIMYVTDVSQTGYIVHHYNVDFGDSIVWKYYYPAMDTVTGEPTGDTLYYNKTWVILTDYDTTSNRQYFEFGIEGTPFGEPEKIWNTYRYVPPEYKHVVDAGSGKKPSYFSGGKRHFFSVAWFPGIWPLEVYHTYTDSLGNPEVESLATTSMAVKDSFTSVVNISPTNGDSIIGKEDIKISVLENSFGEVSVELTGEGKEGGETVLLDTTWQVKMMREPLEYASIVNFFNYSRYKLTSAIQDNHDNVDSAVSIFYPGKPVVNLSFSPEEVRPLYEARGWQDSSNVTVLVTNNKGKPVEGVDLNLEDNPVMYSGGHDHNGDRPSGAFNDTMVTTDSTGNATSNWTPPEFGGYEKIIAKTTNTFISAADSDMVTVKVDGLVFLPETPYYEKVGGTQYHHGPPDYADDHNHWGTPNLIAAIYGIASNYRNKGGEITSINDMSLPFGGLFDINGNWQTPHITHRDGRNADIGGLGTNGRFLKEGLMIDTIIPAMAETLDVNIDPDWEDNHYHFTVSGGE